MSSTAFSRTLTHSAMDCLGRFWSFLYSAGVAHLQSFPHECLCFYPLSVEFGQARRSQRIAEPSLSNGIAIELRERSLR